MRRGGFVCGCGWVGVCSAPIRHFMSLSQCRSRRYNNNNIRAVTAGSTAICQILMSAVHAAKEPTDKSFDIYKKPSHGVRSYRVTGVTQK